MAGDVAASGLEIETKFKVPAFAPIRQALARAGGERLSRRFEENLVLDTSQGTLRGQGILLRLRRDAAAKVTLKLPAKAPEGSGLKIRREIETEVADFGAMQALLGHLGYVPALCYEKVRETWRLGDVLVCLDELPFGHYLEIEGPAEAIVRAAAELGLSMDRALAATYHDLFQEHLASQGLPLADSFVFEAADRQRILDELDRVPADDA